MRELVGTYQGKQTTFAFNDARFLVSTKEKKQATLYECSPYYVLWAEYSEESLEVHILVRKTKTSKLSLVHLVAKVDNESAVDWVAALMQLAYSGIKPQRKLKIMINPNSGPGKGPAIYTKIVEPILKSARCTIDAVYTSHSKHAQELARQISLDYDAVVVISGDGLSHELFNGFAEHADPQRAFSIPLALISSGSGNGACLSVLGLKDGLDVAAATLNAIKGRPMRIDLCSVTQKDKRVFSFMSQATGLMADLDMGTEHLRWMGSTRFVYGYLRGILSRKSCPISVSVKIASRDKEKMYKEFRSGRTVKHFSSAPPDVYPYEPLEFSPLPPLKFGKEDKDGWIDIDMPIIYLYAGKVPFASRDYLQWPLARPDDGLIDLVLQEMISRSQLFRSMSGAERGDPFWLPSQIYIKAEAYRVKPYGPGYLSVDGEEFPFQDFQVEVHRGMAALLSPYGQYAADFQSPLNPSVE